MQVLAILALVFLASGCADAASSPLTRAAAENDMAVLKRLLEEGGAAGGGDSADRVNGADARGMTPLIAATRRGALDAMRALLAAGADPNRPAPEGPRWLPIGHAITAGQAGALRLLLEAGADPNLNSGGGPPIVQAAAEADPVYVELLLAHGANPRGDGNNGRHVISVAVTGGAMRDLNRPLFGGCHSRTVKALLARDPSLKPQPEAVALAKVNGCGEVLRLLD